LAQYKYIKTEKTVHIVVSLHTAEK